MIVGMMRSSITGPRPLKAVLSVAVIFTLIRVWPLSRWMKSVLTPSAFTACSMIFPVSPATKAMAVLSVPRVWSMAETLIPLPPALSSSPLLQLIPPTTSLSA
ncbi:MAG: hypothetical protein BWY50_02158 [Spirochaetes bacterium ADurb.Bin315]|nr:MAG: hypothetical protein BWY50_02158 [Spirochaetes bacterium ADurb.Bin315]